jgi:hypothetical protein
MQQCPICGSHAFVHMWSVGEGHLSHCPGCGVVHGEWPRDDLQRAAAVPPQAWDGVTSLLSERARRGDVLVVREGGSAPPQLSSAGYNAELRLVDAAGLGQLPSTSRYMTIVVASGVSAVENPVTFLARLRERLAPGGVLVMAQPTIEGPKGGRIARSSQRWAMPARWHFTRHTLHLTLLRAGYQRVWIRNEAAGRLLVSAEVATPRALPRLSVIVPVFNEASTCATLLDRLFANELTGIEQEIVIVESNSTDGTRAIVERYRSYPGARVVLEDRPRGKGHAVRSGLAHATGEIVLIQDADLEYDIEDYPLLLQPLLDWQTLFVLGSRHAGDWKLRVFNDAPLTATIFNLGHVFYTWLVNTSLQTEMTDPFTMFKVFRRDCLHGLAFEGRRFDFDFELVMKLVRKGYVPRELPVNYTARSFSEGKKVSFFRDGLSWVWTVVKFRVGALGPGDADRF